MDAYTTFIVAVATVSVVGAVVSKILIDKQWVNKVEAEEK